MIKINLLRYRLYIMKVGNNIILTVNAINLGHIDKIELKV